MKKKIVGILTGAMMMSVSGGWAGYYGGKPLLTDCTREKASFASGTCLGYITGVVDTYTTLIGWGYFDETSKPYCIPGEMKVGHLHNVVVEYLKDHPERLNFVASGEIMNAFIEAFPCE